MAYGQFAGYEPAEIPGAFNFKTLDGPSGSMEGSALWTFADSTLAGSNDQLWANATNTPFALDTTIDNDLQLAVRYFAADAANYIQMRHLVVYLGV